MWDLERGLRMRVVFATGAVETRDFINRLDQAMDQYPALPVCMFLALFVFAALIGHRRRRSQGASSTRGSRRPARRSSGFLDRPILNLGGIPFTGKMATEGMFVCAELGWGKTFLVFQQVLKAYVRAGMGGYLLGAKSEDLEAVMRLFGALGLGHKLVVIGPRHGHKINCFEALTSIAPPDGIDDEIIGFFSSLAEIESRSASKSSGEDTQFFIAHAQRFLGAILVCLRLADQQITASTIYQFLVSLPHNLAQLKDEKWQKNSVAVHIMVHCWYRQSPSPRWQYGIGTKVSSSCPGDCASVESFPCSLVRGSLAWMTSRLSPALRPLQPVVPLPLVLGALWP